MFLKEFAGDLPWAHLDIAGTAWVGRCEAVSCRRGRPASRSARWRSWRSQQSEWKGLTLGIAAAAEPTADHRAADSASRCESTGLGGRADRIARADRRRSCWRPCSLAGARRLMFWIACSRRANFDPARSTSSASCTRWSPSAGDRAHEQPTERRRDRALALGSSCWRDRAATSLQRPLVLARSPSNSDSRDLLAVGRASSAASPSCVFVTNEISASTLGIAAPISTTNGACLTPRSFSVRVRGPTAASPSSAARSSAKSRDSSSLLFSAIALHDVRQAAHRLPRRRVLARRDRRGARVRSRS